MPLKAGGVRAFPASSLYPSPSPPASQPSPPASQPSKLHLIRTGIHLYFTGEPDLKSLLRKGAIRTNQRTYDLAHDDRFLLATPNHVPEQARYFPTTGPNIANKENLVTSPSDEV